MKIDKEKAEFIFIENSSAELIWVEKGKQYKHISEILTDIHNQAIKNDTTSLSNRIDWLECQYVLFQRMLHMQRMEELK
tara:strand:+ start:1276 stop:1512 length:237 start_codon:yes stop_codon:yes gene_type:complete